MKKGKGVLLGIFIIGTGMIFFLALNNQEEAQPEEPKSESIEVFVESVMPKELPFVIEATGTLTAKNKIELYSEVQGILQKTQTPFKEGNTFYKGQDLLRINSEEYRAQLQSNKSTLVNQIASMLPDMEIEFPEASKKWEDYLKNFDINGSLAPLPKTDSTGEKLFVTGKNIVQTYYTVKNQQERISKYQIKAPFTGVVTVSSVNVGTLVRNGQKLGEFIDPSVYELELAIPASAIGYVALRQKVRLSRLDKSQEYFGKVSRINSRIEQTTQTVTVVVEVTDKQLKDGQYFKAKIFGEIIPDALNIEGNLLVENDHVYVVKDSLLALQKVTPLNYVGDSVMIKGLEKGMMLVKETMVNAYPGLKVTISN